MDQSLLQYIQKGLTYAIIPARAGSKGVPNKNIRLLNGYPLIAYSIAAAKLCKNIDRVLVTTDSEQYAAIAKTYGADVPFLRPADIAQDLSTDLEFMQHAIAWFGAHEGRIPEYFVHVRPTSPIREVSVMETAIEAFKAHPQATCLRSAHLSRETPYKWFGIQDDGYFHPILGTKTADEANNPRQSYPKVYIPDGYVDVLSSAFIARSDLLHGDRVLPYLVDDQIDIDDIKDLHAIEMYLAQNTHPLYTYLKSHYPATVVE